MFKKICLTLTSNGSPPSSSSIIDKLWQTSIPLNIWVSFSFGISLSSWLNLLPSFTMTPIISKPSSVKVPVYVQKVIGNYRCLLNFKTLADVIEKSVKSFSLSTRYNQFRVVIILRKKKHSLYIKKISSFNTCNPISNWSLIKVSKSMKKNLLYQNKRSRCYRKCWWHECLCSKFVASSGEKLRKSCPLPLRTEELEARLSWKP